MRKCESCGKAYNDNKDVMCPHCGAVSSKKCTHDSIFDTDRYDRGEDYKGPASTAYKPGVDPHAQRQQETGTFSSMPTPKATPKATNPKKKGPLVGIIVFVIIMIVNLGPTLLEDIDFPDDFGDDYENVYYEDCIVDVGDSEIGILVEDGTHYITVTLNDMYFIESTGVDTVNVADTILHGEYYAYAELVYFEDDYGDAKFEQSCENLSSEANVLKFEFEPPQDNLIYIHDISLELYSGEYVTLRFPYIAINYDADGEITYYADTSEETGMDISIEEVKPVKEYDYYDYFFSFDDSILPDFGGYEDVSESMSEVVTEEVSEYIPESVNPTEAVSEALVSEV